MVETGALRMAVQAAWSSILAIHDGVGAASTSRLLDRTPREVEELPSFDRAYLARLPQEECWVGWSQAWSVTPLAALLELVLLALSYLLFLAIRSVFGR